MKKKIRMIRRNKRSKKLLLKDKNIRNELFRKAFYKAKKLNKIFWLKTLQLVKEEDLQILQKKLPYMNKDENYKKLVMRIVSKFKISSYKIII